MGEISIKNIGTGNTTNANKPELGLEIKNKLIINFNGDNNKVIIGENVKIGQLKLLINGNNNKISIGKHTTLNGVFSCKEHNNIISIGRFTTIGGVKIECEYGTNISIGEDCMFSIDVIIRSGDSHSIIDLETGKRVNLARSISVGDHVWMGYGSSLGKGAIIKNNTVIGSRSFATREFNEGNCVIAGSPAKIVRKNIIWDRRSMSENIPEQHLNNLKTRYMYIGD